MNFTEFVQRLSEWGVADVLLPFFLVFTIVFAVLQKTHALGKGRKNYNVVIALVMGAAIVFPHVLGKYPPSADPVVIINNALPSVSIILVAILCLLLLIGILGGEVRWMGSSLSGWIAIISLLIIIYIFGRATGWPGFTTQMPRWLWWLDPTRHPDTVAVIVIILVFGILIWFITRDDEGGKKGHAFKDFMEDIGKMFGGGK